MKSKRGRALLARPSRRPRGRRSAPPRSATPPGRSQRLERRRSRRTIRPTSPVSYRPSLRLGSRAITPRPGTPRSTSSSREAWPPASIPEPSRNPLRSHAFGRPGNRADRPPSACAISREGPWPPSPLPPRLEHLSACPPRPRSRRRGHSRPAASVCSCSKSRSPKRRTPERACTSSITCTRGRPSTAGSRSPTRRPRACTSSPTLPPPRSARARSSAPPHTPPMNCRPGHRFSEVPSGGHAIVTVRIAVPRDAPPGEQYGFVWAETRSAAPAGGGITRVSRVGIRLYLAIGPGGAPL